jgi:hypothetical protein
MPALGIPPEPFPIAQFARDLDLIRRRHGDDTERVIESQSAPRAHRVALELIDVATRTADLHAFILDQSQAMDMGRTSDSEASADGPTVVAQESGFRVATGAVVPPRGCEMVNIVEPSTGRLR